jgi:hypothetical protein
MGLFMGHIDKTMDRYERRIGTARQLLVKVSCVEFQGNPSSSKGADTRSHTDGQECPPRKAFLSLLLRKERLKGNVNLDCLAQRKREHKLAISFRETTRMCQTLKKYQGAVNTTSASFTLY